MGQRRMPLWGQGLLWPELVLEQVSGQMPLQMAQRPCQRVLLRLTQELQLLQWARPKEPGF